MPQNTSTQKVVLNDNFKLNFIFKYLYLLLMSYAIIYKKLL